MAIMSKEREHNVPKIENITEALGAMNVLGVPETKGWIALSKVKRDKKVFVDFVARFPALLFSPVCTFRLYWCSCMRDFEELDSKASHEREILNS